MYTLQSLTPYYYYVSTFLMWMLFLVWTRADAFNLILKVVFLFVAIWGTVLSLDQLGVVLRIGG